MPTSTPGDGPHNATPFDYAAVTARDVHDGCHAAMREAEALAGEVALVPAGARTFNNTLRLIEQIEDLIATANGRYGFLAHVSPHAEIRAAAHAAEERLEQCATRLGFDEGLYRAVTAYAATTEAQALAGEEARLLHFILRDFRRNGMDLPAHQRARVQERMEHMVSLGIAFRRHINEYDDGLWLTGAGLAGLPDAFRTGLRREDRDGVPYYRVSLDYPELFPFLNGADDPVAREALFRKNHNKAADTNLAILEEAIAVRHEIATALGYPSWAAYVLDVRMAKTPEAVLHFLIDLERRVQPKAAADMHRLRAAQRRRTGADAIVEMWDWRYHTHQVLREQYRVDPFEVAEYFPLAATLDGMFAIYEALVGVHFVPQPGARPWHPDVRFFNVVDRRDGALLAHVYMDLFPRPGKFGHAAAFPLVAGRALPDGTYQRPVSAIVANFTKPTDTSPSLLRHEEVVTLFHEFGHILHQTLTRVRYGRFSGTRVEQDFVEAPSQMLEHWCWAPQAVGGFARHHRSGDPIPADLVGRMVAAKHVSSGIAARRQIYFSRLDLAYHAAGARKDTDAIARALHPITGFPFPEDTHFQAGFGHLFGYDAGYYGYLWSRVFGDDMFTRFEAAGLERVTGPVAPAYAAVGAAYRTGILERGGSVDGDGLVREFLGRRPRPDAFLRDLGLGDGEPGGRAGR